MSLVPDYTYDRFERTTRVDCRPLLRRFVEFIEIHRINILNYYGGVTSTPFRPSFTALDELRNDFQIMTGVIDNARFRMRSHDLFVLVNAIEDIVTALDTIDNSSKWLRSAVTKNDFNPNVEVDYTMRMLQTLENVADTVIGSNNPQDDWVNLAIRNDLTEEQYDHNGGTLINFSRQNGGTIVLRTVVDNIQGERVYGLDLNRKLTFVDDDLDVLTYRQTIHQAVEIMATLIQGDNPEFPDNGIQSGILGGSQSQFALPILERQYFNTFRQDDTLKALKITDLRFEGTALHITFEVLTRIDEVFSVPVNV